MSSPLHAKTPSLPTGTVTFLFTDIEGSTRLWESHPPAMQVALTRHDALVRQCVATHHGHVFKTGGDAFCAAFHTAADAVAAALEAQRALHVEQWPRPVTLRVRMALHTGAAEYRDGDYFGTPLNRVARLLAAGHGGQTLLSESTHDLCRDYLPPLATTRALGEHSLKDLARREAVFQLCHPDLPQSFPPLKGQLAPRDQEVRSIAVLPFVNMSHDEDNEYFADGLSEELLNVLAKIRGLHVASRTSAFFFKGKDVDIQTIAQKLNVATILEGSVRKSGKRVRITAQLIEVASDSHLWSETYDRELDDIFAVQDDIAQSVVKELRSALLGEGIDTAAIATAKAEVEVATAGRTDNAEAHLLYLRGRCLIDRITESDVQRGVDYFQQAIGLDPEFALAWTGLSRATFLQACYGWSPIAAGFERARETAQSGLALASDLADGHLCLGRVLFQYDWNWKAAEVEFERALALAPGNADVLRAVASLAGIRGRQGECINLLRKAVALDPLNTSAQRVLGLRLVMYGRLDEGEAALRAALDFNPRAGVVHLYLSVARLLGGNAAEALELANREILPDLRWLGIAFAQHSLGHADFSDDALRQLIDGYAETMAYQIADACAWRGEIDQAFAWLDRAYAQRDPGLTGANRDPFLRQLHADARWPAFMRKMGFD